MRDSLRKKYISEMRVQGDYLHAYLSTRTQATLPSPQTRTASSVFSKTTRVLEKATKIQTTNAIKKQKPITIINRHAVFSRSASCGQQLQELRQVSLTRNARTTLGRGSNQRLDKNFTAFDFGHFDV